MDRRELIAGATIALGLLSLGGAPLKAEGAVDASKTRWAVRSSIGFDAVAFLGPLSGAPLYTKYYADDAAAFASRLPRDVLERLRNLWAAAQADGFGLLGPNLQVLFSTDGNDRSIPTLLAALRAKETRILPKYRQSRYWNDQDWAWFVRAAPQIETILTAMEKAGFAEFRAARAASLEARVTDVRRDLEGYDVIKWQEKLTGRTFDPTIEVVLLQFCKPHGIKVQGQTFLQSAEYDTPTTVRIAAHEMLHPPFDKNGSASSAAMAVLSREPLIEKIVKEHDPRWGYTSLAGMLDEDLVQALDQLISEALGVGRNPADRWRRSDDGMHVMAAGFYGLLRADRWTERGGNIENWLLEAAEGGRLAPGVFHGCAARVLERLPDRLWPLAPQA